MKRFKHLFSGGLVLLAFITWSGNAAALNFEYNPATQQMELTIGGGMMGERVIPIPSRAGADAGESFLSFMSGVVGDFATVSEQAQSQTLDEALSFVSGCIKDPDGNPIVGALVIGIKPDSLQLATYAVTAGATIPGVYSVTPLGYPVIAPGLSPGCYTMIIPPGLLDFMLTGIQEGVKIFGGGATIDPASTSTNSNTAISMAAFIPGYVVDPGIRHISVNSTGVLEATSAGELDVRPAR